MNRLQLELYLCFSGMRNSVLVFAVDNGCVRPIVKLEIYSVLFENKLKTIDVIPGKGQQSLQSGSLMDFF